MPNHWKAAALHAAIIAVIYCLCPIATSGDSRWTIPVALNLIEHGSTSIEPYAATALAEPAYRWERGPDGKLYASYPIAVAVIAAPFLPPLKMLAAAGRLVIRSQPDSPVIRAFLAGDFLASYGLVEMLIASFLIACAAGVQLLIALEFLPIRFASLLTFVFAFATPVWSTASRSMGNHTPALLMLTIAVCLLVFARRSEKLASYASIPLAIAFMLRPTTAIAGVLLTAYVALYHRRHLRTYVALAIPFCVLFLAYNLAVRHALFQRYFTEPGVWPPAPLLLRFGLQLISPSRGLFVFSPVLLFSIWGMWLAWRNEWLSPLAMWLVAIVAAQVLLVTRFHWPGYAYGPRYFTEMTPLFTLFLIPVFQRWSGLSWICKVTFYVLLAWSVFVHGRGATDFAVHRWNETPAIVDMDRAWDWSDPQFLRGLP